MAKWWHLGVMTGVGLMLLSCSSDGVNKRGQESVKKLYDGLADRYCEYIFRCCDAAESKAVAAKRFTDEASCKAYMKLDYLVESYTAQLAVGERAIDIDDKAVDACIEAWKSLSCDTPFHQLKSPEACESDTIFAGARGAGEACDTSRECVAGHHCVKAYGSLAEGICIPFRKQGEPCSTSLASTGACDEGLVCANPKEGVRTCKPPAKVGESCLEIPCDTDKDPDLFCDYTSDPDSPVCAQLKGDGEPCKSASNCKAGLFCDSYTDPSNPVCRSPGGPGEACSYAAQCRPDLYCDQNSDPINPTCQPLKDEGQPCSSSNECVTHNCDYATQTCGPGAVNPSLAVCDGK